MVDAVDIFSKYYQAENRKVLVETLIIMVDLRIEARLGNLASGDGAG